MRLICLQKKLRKWEKLNDETRGGVCNTRLKYALHDATALVEFIFVRRSEPEEEARIMIFLLMFDMLHNVQLNMKNLEENFTTYLLSKSLLAEEEIRFEN